MGRRSDPRWRDEAASGLMASLVPELGLEGPALVVEDPVERVAAALEGAGVSVVRWSRLDRAGGPVGEAWPRPGPFGSVLIRLPKARESLLFALHAALSVIRPGGRVLVYGANDEGIASTPRWMEPLVGPVLLCANRRRCRVLEGVWPGGDADERGATPVLRDSLASWRTVVELDLGWGAVPWIRYPGTFAGDRLDEGTGLLVRHLPSLPAQGAFLDFGGGAGVLAAALLHACPGARGWMVEPDAVAREAARENVPAVRMLPVGGWAGEGPFDVVVSNPPYHVGKGETLDVVEELVAGSARSMAPTGELRMVVQRRLPVEGLLVASFRSVAAVADAGPYRVWGARDPRGD